ncbi:Tat pathway signal sequence domain protein [Brevundimonas sp. GCM10030266]|uniref:Tat pathway signal sequence domain protein n=1 Tax=Brevundimonas sp. GCM10030266 TaxID=3273386 RepID=UPI0036215259
MRRVLKVSLASALVAATLSAVAPVAVAQSSGTPRPGGGQEGQQAEERTSSRQPRIAPLRRRAAAGPCPYVKILYDAARYVEMTGDRVSAANVGFTGEVEGLVSDCSYQSDEPIVVETRVLFNLGRGPQADGASRTYRYWIAVTERNSAVLDKVYFDLPVTFENGATTATVTRDNTVVIPRANATTSGSNFEILVGFDVTPQMAEFNRSGSRFRVNAGTTAPTTQPPAQ